jgi:low temperature requirement protein LtrA
VVHWGSRQSLRRDRSRGHGRVTTIELFFDLVYVFAVTQLSHYLLRHLTLAGAVQVALLLAMVWQLWAYTSWMTNWLDPERIGVRLMMLALMLASLVMSAGLPEAFGDGGLIVGGAYAVMQVGRSAFVVWALPAGALRRNFERIWCWCCASGGLAVAGGLAGGTVRELLWLAAVGVDLTGSTVGFWTPGLGRSSTREWDIEGGHFAERCQAFILIALGESVVVIGATLAGLLSGPLAAPHGRGHVSAAIAFVLAFVGSAGLWWLYFDRSAEAGAQVIERSADPGALGRSAYHLIHPVMVAGIIVVAAADDVVLSGPGARTGLASALLILGGPALFLAGHAAFKAAVWRKVSVPRLAGIAVLALLGLVAPHVSVLVLAACAAVVVIGVVVADWRGAPKLDAAAVQEAADN